MLDNTMSLDTKESI